MIYNGKLFKSLDEINNKEIQSFSLINSLMVISVRKSFYKNIKESSVENSTVYGLPEVMSSKFIILALMDYSASVCNLVNIVKLHFEKDFEISSIINKESYCQSDSLIFRHTFDDLPVEDTPIKSYERLCGYRNRFTHGDSRLKESLMGHISLLHMYNHRREDFYLIEKEIDEVASQLHQVIKQYLNSKFEHVYLPVHNL